MSEAGELCHQDGLYASFDGTQAMFRHVERRLASLELSMAAMETEHAVTGEKQKFMELRFNQIDRRLEKIEGHISRLVWLIIAAILGGLMSIIMQSSVLVT